MVPLCLAPPPLRRLFLLVFRTRRDPWATCSSARFCSRPELASPWVAFSSMSPVWFEVGSRGSACRVAECSRTTESRFGVDASSPRAQASNKIAARRIFHYYRTVNCVNQYIATDREETTAACWSIVFWRTKSGAKTVATSRYAVVSSQPTTLNNSRESVRILPGASR